MFTIFRCFIIGLLICSCSDGVGRVEEGVKLDLYVKVEGGSLTQGKVQIPVAGSDSTVAVDKGYLVLSEVSIKGDCTDFSSLLRFFTPSLAFAHSETTSTVLGEPHILDLSQISGEALFLGTLSPGVGSYCGVEAGFYRADYDAEGQPSDLSMVGKTFYLSGEYQGEGIELSSKANLIPSTVEFSEKVVFSESNHNHELVIRINLDELLISSEDDELGVNLADKIAIFSE